MGAERGMPGRMRVAGMDMCPMAVEGTRVGFEEVEGGVALVFTTDGAVDDLRRRVEHMATMRASMMRSGMMRGGRMPPVVARSEEVEGGARLVLTPEDPADLRRLREHARLHAARMESGECPMMDEGAPFSSTPESAEPNEAHEHPRPEETE